MKTEEKGVWANRKNGRRHKERKRLKRKKGEDGKKRMEEMGEEWIETKKGEKG